MWRMHVVYICISVINNYGCTTHTILPFITITTNFLSLFQFYRKTFLRSVDPKQPKNVKFSLWSIIETFPRRGAWLFRGGAKILRGGAKRSQGRCAPLHTSPQNPAMVWFTQWNIETMHQLCYVSIRLMSHNVGSAKPILIGIVSKFRC
jgi:hypothetical protein